MNLWIHVPWINIYIYIWWIHKSSPFTSKIHTQTVTVSVEMQSSDPLMTLLLKHSLPRQCGETVIWTHIYIYYIYIPIYGRAPHDQCHKLLATSIQIPSQIKLNHMYIDLFLCFGWFPWEGVRFQITISKSYMFSVGCIFLLQLYNLCYSLI